MTAGRLKPRWRATSAKARPNTALEAWNIQARPFLFSVSISGAPQVFMVMSPAALVIGMAASPTEEGQIPTTASTLLISISFLTASTAASGLV